MLCVHDAIPWNSSKSGGLVQISANITAEAEAQSTAHMIMRNVYESLGIPAYEPALKTLPIVTRQDSLRTIP